MTTLRPTIRELLALHQGSILHAINQPHRYLFLDGTYLKDVSTCTASFASIPENGVFPCWAELKLTLSLNPSLLPVLDYVDCGANVNFQCHLPDLHVECIQDSD